MTCRRRGSAPSPDFSPAASSPMDNSKFKQRHHNNNFDDDEVEEVDDYTDASQSQSLYEESEGKEEEEEGDDDEPVIADDLYSQSESINNNAVAAKDQLSSPMPKYQRVRNNILFENSPLNSPKLLQPIFNYMNVAPLPIFRGTPDECPTTHLSRFAKVCRANNASSIDMMVKIFPVTLENEASLWYDLNIEPYSLSWEEIKSSFTEAYYRNDHVDQFRSELMMINQSGEESVRSYFLRLQLMLKKWPDHGLSDGILKGIFIDGLREDFQDWIIPQRPNSLDEALRFAFDWEQVESIRAARRKKKCGFCHGPHEERGCEVKERMKELWFKSKEKQVAGVWLKGSDQINSGDGVVRSIVELGRSVSVGRNSVVGKKDVGVDEKEEVGEMLLGGKQKSQCQCGKHQCWKKRLERNNSFNI